MNKILKNKLGMDFPSILNDIPENEYLVEGAELKCSCGTETSLLKVPNSQSVLLKGAAKINCKDCRKEENIQSFGNCTNVFNQKCQELMDLEDKWVNLLIGNTKIEQVNGEDAVILWSVLMCNRGGIIIPQNSGQNLLMYTKDGKIIYNWNRIKKLFEKDSSLITEKELRYLVEVAESLSESEDMVEFIKSGYTKEIYDSYFRISDVFNAVIKAAQYETIIKGVTGNLSEEEYIKQIMKYEVMKESTKHGIWRFEDQKEQKNIITAMQNFRFEKGDDSFKYPSWIWKTQDFSYMPDIYHFFRVEEIVRYQGKGTEILVIEGITARNDIEDINDNLKTVVSNFLENALYVYGLGKSKPIIQILVPTATSLPDLEDKGEYDYKAFIVDFDLHEIQIEIPEECGIEKELKNKHINYLFHYF